MITDNNILTKEEENIIKNNLVLSSDFAWYRNESMIGKKHQPDIAKDYPIYIHNLKSCGSDTWNSEWSEFFISIIRRFIKKNKIFTKNHTVLRACVNETLPKKTNDIMCNPHVDYTINHKIFILYLTDSSGDTVIYNEKWKEGKEQVHAIKDNNLNKHASITPEFGKLVCFNGLNYHAVKFPKAKDRRIICIFAISEE
tara:strand:- start:402 stop:995 length:594 start_codon:yes stop_codon:yes gene_type:complete